MAETKKPATKKTRQVFAKQTCRVALKSGTVLLDAGSAYLSSDPVVKERPELFDDAPPIRTPHVRSAVERATAAPGQKRG